MCALVDVTELLLDPDFVDQVTLIHRVPTVNSKGENVLVESSVVTIGSVQPASGKTLERLPDLFRVANVYSFWIKGNIISDGYAKYPDLISFQGQNYAVQTIADWLNYGAGWCEGTAVRLIPTL